MMNKDRMEKVRSGLASKGYEDLLRLLDKGSLDHNILMREYKLGHIQEGQYIALSDKLHKQDDIIKEGLADTSRKLATEAEHAGIDLVTGLPNRKNLLPRLDRLIEEMNHKNGGEKRSHIPCAIMVIALDMTGLKTINDQYGHDKGDELLLTFANHLKKETKEGQDIVFRASGNDDKPGSDEFFIILPIFREDTDHKKLFEDIKTRINTKLSFKANGSEYPITAAMGFTVLKRGESKTAKELIIEADEQERRDKRARKGEEE